MKQRLFRPIRTALVPIIHGCDGSDALAVAVALANEVVLTGLVAIAPEQTLSAGVARARQVRRRLQALAASDGVRARPRVRVSRAPWAELSRVVAVEQPDLLVLCWPCQLEALGTSAGDVLKAPPCDIALVRGPLPARPQAVLVPVRGGPYAELALRLALSLRPARLAALHLVPGTDVAEDAPFRGLARVLARLPEVQLETRALDGQDPAEAILAASRDSEVLVVGATAQRGQRRTSLGPVANRLLREAPAGVIVVKTRRPMPAPPSGEAAGAGAISVLVDKWFAENTFQAQEFADLEMLLALKRAQGVTISLALPALNEAATVGKVIRTLRRELVERVPLVDELVLIDSDSSDRTRAIARRLGVPVYVHQQLLPELGARSGKGEALWKSLLVTRGDIIAWIDTDIVNIHPRFVYGVLGPLLLSPAIQFVKGFYRRPLRVGDKIQAGGGGRVTELTARPLLNLFFPELSGVIQPLSGEYAGRRSALERLSFFSGYGVETGLLIDIFEAYGLAAIAQVDLLERIHHNKGLEALGKMSFAIIQAVLRKLERRYNRAMLEDVNKTMKLPRYEAGDYFLDVEEVIEGERPPMADVPAYRNRREALG
jgi:glucosyl-3-phosphoglycerate synthase